MKVVATERIPIKMWLEDIEDGALDQAKNMANLPFAFKHIAVMPDAHQGYGMPIGGVMAVTGVVIPNAVGVDIGCGMCAVKTSLVELDQDTVKKIFGGSQENHGGIRSCVPVGFSHQSDRQDEKSMPNYPDKGNTPIIQREYQSALKQMGTLGGGNHFIEIQKGSDGFIWLMVHSGSRNIGLKVANHYNDMAKALNKKWFSSVPANHDLAFLPLHDELAESYLIEMQYCVDFALANRKLMMERIIGCVTDVIPTTDYYEPINIAHNYAVMENHFGKNVMIHRKGATRARDGETGIIPGSQGASSYIVKGKGNEQSFRSCSHGAGRKMGRKQAKRELNLENEIKKLDDMGIVHSIRCVDDLDEAEGAYKDVSAVMKNQEDLVGIEVELRPLGVIKG